MKEVFTLSKISGSKPCKLCLKKCQIWKNYFS